MKDDVSQPLSGIKVLDLSRFIAGPYCTAMLGDFGADVAKIERPRTGDDSRHFGPQIGDESAYFLSFNRNKRSVVLDVRSEQGQCTLRELAIRADVLVENFRPGVLEAMGLAPDLLHEVNPGLVITRISGFGQDGPLSGRPSFDAIAQAESGLMSITGDTTTPMPTGTFIADYAAGMHAAFATMVALFERTRSGQGQVVDVSLLEAAFSLLMSGPTEYGHDGSVMGRVGPRDRYSSPAGLYPVADGWVYIITKDNDQFSRLLDVVGRSDLMGDARFASNSDRVENRSPIDFEITEWTRGRMQGEVIAALKAASILCAPVRDVGQAASNPQLLHRNAIVSVTHSALGSIDVPGVVAKLSRTDGSVRLAPPVLGSGTDDVLKEWGVADLSKEGWE